MKAREVKRAKLVAKYAAKRAALKEAGDYEGLQKLPKTPQVCVFTTAAPSPAAPKDTCASSASHVSSSAKWLLPA